LFKAFNKPAVPSGEEAFHSIPFIKIGKAIVKTLLVLFVSVPVDPATPDTIYFPKSLFNKSKIPSILCF